MVMANAFKKAESKEKKKGKDIKIVSIQGG